jgi:hypothetical protein
MPRSTILRIARACSLQALLEALVEHTNAHKRPDRSPVTTLKPVIAAPEELPIFVNSHDCRVGLVYCEEPHPASPLGRPLLWIRFRPVPGKGVQRNGVFRGKVVVHVWQDKLYPVTTKEVEWFIAHYCGCTGHTWQVLADGWQKLSTVCEEDVLDIAEDDSPTDPPPSSAGMRQSPPGAWQSPAGAAQSPTGTGQSSASAGQSPSGAWQSPAGAGQSPSGAWQSPAGAGQAPTGASQSSASAGQAPSGAWQSPAGAGQSSAGASPSPLGASQSPAGAGQSPAGANQSPADGDASAGASAGAGGPPGEPPTRERGLARRPKRRQPSRRLRGLGAPRLPSTVWLQEQIAALADHYAYHHLFEGWLEVYRMTEGRTPEKPRQSFEQAAQACIVRILSKRSG